MSARSEASLAKMRKHLADAHDLEASGVIWLADAHGRCAAAELANAILEDSIDADAVGVCPEAA